MVWIKSLCEMAKDGKRIEAAQVDDKSSNKPQSERRLFCRRKSGSGRESGPKIDRQTLLNQLKAPWPGWEVVTKRVTDLSLSLSRSLSAPRVKEGECDGGE
jgi:hypothetical protein